MRLKTYAALVLIAAAIAAFHPTQIAAASSGCPKELQLAGMCSSNTGSEIVVDGSKTESGSPGTSPIGHDGDSGSSFEGNGEDEEFSDAEYDFGTCLANWQNYIGCFLARNEAEATPEAPAPAPAMPAVTISDLARFAPDGTPMAGEPDNVGVAGLPTNFVATASAHTVDGELFGFPVTVRFTPIGFDFDYGDGTTTTTTDGGRTWADLEQAQFTPTATSHAYAERGEYLAGVDVRYTAEVDLGIGWLPIDGELTSDGPDQRIRIFEAHTALVAHTCEQAPSSPGC